MQNVMQALYLTRNARGLPASVRRYTLVQQPDHVFHMPGVLIQLLRQRLNHIHACCILSLKSHRRDGGGFWLFEISLLRPA